MIEKKDIRWKQRFNNFKKALGQLEEGVAMNSQDRLAQEGLIQRFEYTFELAWKCLQDLLQERGLVEVRGPKPVLQQAFQDGLLQDGVLWMEMLRARNEASHLYDEDVFVDIFEKTKTKFLKPLQELEKKLSGL